MDSYEIIITPDAETDLFEIRDYIAYTLLVPDIALNYIRAIRSELQKLTYMASSIAPIEQEPWHSRGVRKIIAKNFYIYYRPDDASGKVYILSNLRKAGSAQSIKKYESARLTERLSLFVRVAFFCLQSQGVADGFLLRFQIGSFSAASG